MSQYFITYEHEHLSIPFIFENDYAIYYDYKEQIIYRVLAYYALNNHHIGENDIFLNNDDKKVSIKPIIESILNLQKSYDWAYNAFRYCMFNFVYDNNVMGLTVSDKQHDDFPEIFTDYIHPSYKKGYFNALYTEDDSIKARIMGYNIIYNPIYQMIEKIGF